MRRSIAIFVTALACTTLLAPAWSAPPENRGKPDHAGNGNGNGNNKGNGNSGGKNKGNDKGNGKDSDTNVSVTLSTAGISISTARGYAVQAGATGYGSLPPGIRKNLARGKPLPPGIAKKMVPGPMLARLPVHPGYEWRVAGNDLILVAIATGIVADVLANVFD
ncbi:anti-virulence regulator CigR family protein [Achromobacter xylosoxidans]|uniref:anti-virulence regulator CigR family protein n=1 Tax=Alcaligenes xylosoxydans xylosoxydans TaxID=85698 RepID=UPI0012A7C00C|nr:anti-virulence regulator CigR family protein [Achromobacter xylosoxidans]CUR67334.1 putative integral membrane protein [Achromobacter xylosoxidans]